MRDRLLKTFVLLLILMAGLIGVVYGWALQQALEGYEQEHIREHVQLIHDSLLYHFNERGDWEGVEKYILPLTLSLGVNLVLVEPDSDVVLASTTMLRQGSRFAEAGEWPINILLFDNDKEIVGVAYVKVAGNFATVNSKLSRALVNGLVLTIGVAFSTAVLLSTYFSRSITAPLQAMEQAARQVAQGDYQVRLAIPPTQDEVAALAHSFNEMATQLDKVESSRRQLIADVSHDLNTPLAVLRGYLEGLITERILDRPTAVRAFHAMEEEALYLQKLIASLQELSLWETGQISIHPQPIPLIPFLEHLVARLTPIALQHNNNISLTTAIAPPLPTDEWLLIADPLMAEQAIYNVLSNALQHNPPQTSVTIQLETSATYLHIHICDNGIGIPTQLQQQIFERFYRQDAARNRQNGGLGIGLTIVQRILQAHNGQIRLQSTGVAGAGSCFTLSWPHQQPLAHNGMTAPK